MKTTDHAANGLAPATEARSGVSTGLMLAGAVSVLALPSAVLAFTTRVDALLFAAPVPEDAPLDAGSGGLRLARGLPLLQSLARGALYPFTPAKNPNRPDRSVTVAVRLDPQAMKAIQVRTGQSGASEAANLRLAQTAFNLGVARGYRNFAQTPLGGQIVPPAPARKSDLPDLEKYSIAPSAGTPRESRFGARIVMDEKQPIGRAPRTFAGDKEDQVDLGGSYRVTRNFDVTAGVRYHSQDRERLVPLTDGKQDNQAVYVGTQLRF